MKTILKEPNLYDLLYEDVVEDIQVYLNLTKEYNKIVEYGAGTGRITIPLAKSGKTVYAIDNEELMLSKLKNNLENTNVDVAKNVNIINANMIDYKHFEMAECVIMPLTVFNYILTNEEQNRCLKNISESLKYGGKLVLELLTKNTFREINESEEYKYIKSICLEKRLL